MQNRKGWSITSQILETIKTRRSVRSYQDKQVPKELLDEILTAGLYAPSGKNCQLWQFTVVQGTEKLETLHAAIAIALGRPDYSRFYNAPTLIMASAPRGFPLAVEDCAVALENMFLAAHALGLGSVWINQLRGVCGNPEIRAVLTSFGVPAEHDVHGCAAIGYPASALPDGRENRGKIVYA